MSQLVRHLAVPSGFLMVLRQGDDVLAHLAELMRLEDIPSASFSGFGFVESARFGFFDFARGEYDPGEFQDLEITGFTGTCAWMDAEPSIHAHASGADPHFGLFSGHVLELIVGRGSFEITIAIHPNRLQRALETAIGDKVLQLDPDRIAMTDE